MPQQSQRTSIQSDEYNTAGYQKGATPSLSERCLDTVSNGGLLQPLVRPVLRVRSGGIWKGASFQVRPTHVRMRFASVVTGLGKAVQRVEKRTGFADIARQNTGSARKAALIRGQSQSD